MYNFNEGVGNTAFDISGNERHLELINTLYSIDTPFFQENITWSNNETTNSITVSPLTNTTYVAELYNEDFNCFEFAEITVYVDETIDCNTSINENSIEKIIHKTNILGRHSATKKSQLILEIDKAKGSVEKKLILK